MTHVRQEKRILIYQGFLKQFGLQRDGRFTYIVLTEARRGYMILDDNAPITTGAEHWRRIGDAPASISKATFTERSMERSLSYFVIEGEDVANVVFDRLSYTWKGSVDDLITLLNEIDEEESLKTSARVASASTTKITRSTETSKKRNRPRR